MERRQLTRAALMRLAFLAFFSFLVVAAGSELLYMVQKEQTDRASRQIELVIPAGTAGKIAAEPALAGQHG